MSPVAAADATGLTWQEFSRIWRDPAGRRQLGLTGFPLALGPERLFRWINVQAGLRAALHTVPALAHAVETFLLLRRDGQIRTVDHLMDGSEAAAAVQSLFIQLARHREAQPDAVVAAYTMLIQDADQLGAAQAAFLDSLWQIVRELPDGAVTPEHVAWLLNGERLSVLGIQQLLNLIGGWADHSGQYLAVIYEYLQRPASAPRPMVELLDWAAARRPVGWSTTLRHLYRLHASADVRGSAAVALIASGQPGNIEYVQRFFPYETESVRYAIIGACTTWCDPVMPPWIARRIRAAEDLGEFQELMKFARRHPGPPMLDAMLAVAGDARRIPDARVIADLVTGLVIYLEDDPASVGAALEHLLQHDSTMTANLVQDDADVRGAIQHIADSTLASSLRTLASRLLQDNPAPENPLP